MNPSRCQGEIHGYLGITASPDYTLRLYQTPRFLWVNEWAGEKLSAKHFKKVNAKMNAFEGYKLILTFRLIKKVTSLLLERAKKNPRSVCLTPGVISPLVDHTLRWQR